MAEVDHAKYRNLLEQHDCAFHRTIISGCQSQWILRFHSLTYDHMLRYRSQALKKVSDEQLAAMLERSKQDHLVLRDAALERETDRLVELLDVHIHKGEEFAERFTTNGNGG